MEYVSAVISGNGIGVGRIECVGMRTVEYGLNQLYIVYKYTPKGICLMSAQCCIVFYRNSIFIEWCFFAFKINI